MRWSSVGRAVAAVGIVVAVVLAPLPASAVSVKPPSVDPLTDLPSTIGRITIGHPNGPSMGKPGLRQPAWVRGKARAKTPTPEIPKPPAVGTPVTAPSRFAKTVGGANMFGAAFNGGFLLGAEGLKLYGLVTDTDPMAGLCGADQWLQVGYDILSFGIGTSSCVGVVDHPNADAVGGVSISYGGGGWTWLGNTTPAGYTYTLSCMSGTTPTIPSDAVWQVQDANSTGGWSTKGPPNANSSTEITRCRSAYAATTLRTTVALGATTAPIYRLFRPSTGETLAQTNQATANPERQVNCTIVWEDGTTTYSVDNSSGFYTEAEGVPMEAIERGCQEAYVSKPGAGPDLMPSEIKVGSRNTETGAQTEISTQEVPEYTEEERRGLDPGDGTGLKLWKIRDKTTYSCMTWAIDCADWWTDTDAGTQPKTADGTYRCTWGGNKVALNECGPYRHTFNETELDDRTITGADGEPIPYPIPGPGPNPVPEPGPGPRPGTDPAGECWADGWASVANPLDWVLVPVKCALVWAFSPRVDFLEEVFAESSSKWELTMPGRIGGIVATAFTVDAVTGCRGPHVFIPLSDYWDGWVDFDAYPLSACAEPASTVAFWSRLIGGVVLVYLTALGIIRRVSATVNAPGVGGGGSS